VPEYVDYFRSFVKKRIHLCSIVFLTPFINGFIVVTKVFVKQNGWWMMVP
jgi:hypothetical protein